LALKQLDGFYDKFNKDFLDNFFGEYKPRIMKALFKHCKPANTAKQSPMITRILGKMAGRNRNFFNAPPSLVRLLLHFVKADFSDLISL